MSQAKFAVAITADDKTAKGIASAEKRLGTIPKHASAVNKSQARAVQDSVARSGRGMLRTLGAVEQASAKVFGGRSITSGLTSRLSAVREAAAATGEGLGEAASAGGALEGAMAGLGVVAGATIGVLAAAGYAAFKLVDGWAKGAAQIGRTADMIGVARKEMQEFSAAAERMGVDRGAATGGLGGLSQTLNDARYGRNRDALAVLGKLGIKLIENSDGTVNVGAMLPAIADAVQRQNSSGRRTIAKAFGFGDALIGTFAQGGKALTADMADAGNTAYVASDDDIATGQRIGRKGAEVGQLKDKALAIAGRAAAVAAEPGYDGVLAMGDRALSGATSFGGIVQNVFSPAADRVDRGGRAIERGGAAVERAAKVIDRAGVVAAIRRAAGETGNSADDLLHIAYQESRLNPTAHAPTSSARGIFEFLEKSWLGIVKDHGAAHGLGWAADAVRGGQAGRGTAMRARILALRDDPYVSALMGGELLRENRGKLQRVLGRAPSLGEAYAAHFFGIGGASQFLRAERANPDADAPLMFKGAAKANHSIFYAKDGRHRTLDEVLNVLSGFVERPIKVEVAVNAPGHSATATVHGQRPGAPAVSHAFGH